MFWEDGVYGRHCQVDENHVDHPPRYWALARRGPTMLGIKNSRQPQLDNTRVGADANVRRRVPIPNVCEAVGVPYVDTFDMLRALSTQFSWQVP